MDGFELFAMCATGSAYAFDAEFSDALLRTLEQPVQKNDQRVDRRAGGITYKKVFENARSRVLLSGHRAGTAQDPRSFGQYESTVLLPVAATVPTAYNSFAASRSIYERVFRLLQIVGRENLTADELRDAIDQDPIYVLRKDDGAGGGRTLSTERLEDYLLFLRTVRWLVQPGGRYQLTNAGRDAIDDLFFNRLLLDAIETYVLGQGVTFAFLDQVVKELLADMLQPTPPRIKERAAMKGLVVDLSPATLLAFKLLGSTGKFAKGSADAIYPSV